MGSRKIWEGGSSKLPRRALPRKRTATSTPVLSHGSREGGFGHKQQRGAVGNLKRRERGGLEEATAVSGRARLRMRGWRRRRQKVTGAESGGAGQRRRSVTLGPLPSGRINGAFSNSIAINVAIEISRRRPAGTAAPAVAASAGPPVARQGAGGRRGRHEVSGSWGRGRVQAGDGTACLAWVDMAQAEDRSAEQTTMPPMA